MEIGTDIMNCYSNQKEIFGPFRKRYFGYFICLLRKKETLSRNILDIAC